MNILILYKTIKFSIQQILQNNISSVLLFNKYSKYDFKEKSPSFTLHKLISSVCHLYEDVFLLSMGSENSFSGVYKFRVSTGEYVYYKILAEKIYKYNDNYVLVIENGLNMIMYDVENLARKKIAIKNINHVHRICIFNQDIILCSDSKGYIIFWKLSTNSSFSDLTFHSCCNAICKVNESLAAFGLYNSKIILLDIFTNEYIHEFNDHKESVNEIIKYDESIIISCSDDKNICMLNIETKSNEKVLCNKSPVSNIVLLNKSTLLSANFKNKINVWDLSSFSIVYQVDVPDFNFLLSNTMFKMTETLFAVASVKNDITGLLKIHKFDRISYKENPSHSNFVNCVLRLDDDRILTGSSDRTFIIWMVSQSQNIFTSNKFEAEIVRACILSSSCFAVGLSNSKVIFYEDLQQIGTVDHKSKELFEMCAMTKTILVTSTENKTYVWSKDTLKSLFCYSHASVSLCKVTDNIFASAVSRSYSIKICYAHFEKVIAKHDFPKIKKASPTAICSLSNNILVAGFSNGDIIVIPLLRSVILWHHEIINYQDITDIVRIANDRFVTVSKERKIRVWSLPLTCLMTLEGHSNWVNKLCMLSENILVSVSDDMLIKVWDLSTQNVLLTFMND